LSHPLLILGASTRAAAFSALRCGLTPRCADYFADRDLAAVCRVDRIDPRDAARQFIELADSLDPTSWIYTGGLENHPEWVDAISRRHVLWGIGGAALRAVRDPIRLAGVLERHDIPCPRACLDPTGLPRDGTWLKKPLASGGGFGIEPLRDHDEPARKSHYFQEQIDGPSFSALFVGARERARLVGVTRQWIGIVGSPFVYRGSIGPMPVSAELAARLQALGDVVAREFGVAGWFGVDFILRDGIPWPVEINPRYTASVEVHEIATGRSVLAEHQAACDASCGAAQNPIGTDERPARVVAKWVLYAQRDMVAPEIIPEDNDPTDLVAARSIADVPRPGTCIGPGEPVMTLMATGPDLAECGSRLASLRQNWSERLGIAADEVTMSERLSRGWRSGHDDVVAI
jgi:predicted ATP-grasp superfamily ATP-dependent carboligase